MAASIDDKPKIQIPDTLDDLEAAFGNASVPSSGNNVRPEVPNTLQELEARWTPSARPLDREVQYRATGVDAGPEDALMFVVAPDGSYKAASREYIDGMQNKRQFKDLLGFSGTEQELSADKAKATIYIEDGAKLLKLELSPGQVDRMFGPDEEPKGWDGSMDASLGLRVGAGVEYDLRGIRRTFDSETGKQLAEKVIPPRVGLPSRE